MSIATIAAALDQYNANLNWEDSATSARDFVASCRFLLANRIIGMSHASSNLSYASIEAEMLRAKAFMDSLNTTGRTSFTSARSRWAR